MGENWGAFVRCGFHLSLGPSFFHDLREDNRSGRKNRKKKKLHSFINLETIKKATLSVKIFCKRCIVHFLKKGNIAKILY